MMVSIAMTTYNGSQFLKEQLDSILAQTYKDFELVIIDDGSSDDTIAILQRYAENDTRIHLFQNETNLGYAKNFLKAISLTTGDYIFLSDQDDIWIENKIAWTIDVLTQFQSVELLVQDYIPFSTENTAQLIALHSEKIKMGGKIRKLSFRETLNACSFAGMNMCITANVRNSLRRFLDKDIISHDWLISLIAGNAKTAFFAKNYVTFHRVHKNSTSIKQVKEKHAGSWEHNLVTIKYNHFLFAKKIGTHFLPYNKFLINTNVYLYKKRLAIFESTSYITKIFFTMQAFLFSVFFHFPIKRPLADLKECLFQIKEK